MEKLIMVRYGELNTKGKNRKLFIRQLKKNIQRMLKEVDQIEYEFNYDRGYIYHMEKDHAKVEEVLKNTFGIVSFSTATIVSQDHQAIIDEAVATLAKHYVPNMTFKVGVKRADKRFGMRSMDFARVVATALLQKYELKVDLTNPSYHLEIDLRDGRCFVFDKRQKALEGYPVGINGKALVMLSGGIDSPVAAYLAMKKGLEIECIHFASPPYTSKRAHEKVVSLCQHLAKYQPTIKLNTVEFTTIQESIFKHVNSAYAMMVMRHMMYDIASDYTHTIKAFALVNGESLGQVASQTLKNMAFIDYVCPALILRPLICMDKLEIIHLSKQLNMYETSILPYEDCCTIFKVDNPTTNVNRKVLAQFEQNLEWDELKKTGLSKTTSELVVIANESDELF